MATRAEQRKGFWTKGIAEFDAAFVRDNFTCDSVEHFPPVIIEKPNRRRKDVLVHQCSVCGDKIHIKWICRVPFIMKVEKGGL